MPFGGGEFDIRATTRIWCFLAYILEDVSEPNGKDSAVVGLMGLMGIGKGIEEDTTDQLIELVTTLVKLVCFQGLE